MFTALDSDGQAEVIAKIDLLKLLGPDLRRPHADTLSGSRHANMKELRADMKAKVIRIAFAFNPNRMGILSWQRTNRASIKSGSTSDCSRRPMSFATSI